MFRFKRPFFLPAACFYIKNLRYDFLSLFPSFSTDRLIITGVYVGCVNILLIILGLLIFLSRAQFPDRQQAIK